VTAQPLAFRLVQTAEGAALPIGALIASATAFGLIVAALGNDPFEVYRMIFVGGFGSWFSWENTLQRVAPLLLTALCAALPAQLGLAVIGGEGAFVLGGLAAVEAAILAARAPAWLDIAVMLTAGMAAGALIVGAAGILRAWRGVSETISSLLLNYLAIAVFNQLIEGPLRDSSDLNRASTFPLPEQAMIGTIGNSGVHWGLVVGLVACVVDWAVIFRTTTGFSMRIAGGNAQAARMVGIPVDRLIVGACALGGAAAGLAGAIETAAVYERANNSLIAGYGFSGILISFIARHNPLFIIPAAILFGGIGASGGLIQRRLGLPDAAVTVLQGCTFLMVLMAETFRGRSLRDLVLGEARTS
jgi:general nucleoside transport system permease protein